jgi:hypothetical protein
MLSLFTLALDPTRLLAAQGFTADPWQRELLLSTAPQILLNCCRGAGKSRVTSALALHTALFHPEALVLLVSRSQRQAGELFRYVRQAFSAVGRPVPAIRETHTQLELANGSRIVCLPGKEETIRSFQGVKLLVLDEAARIPDELYASVSPMTGVSRGRTVCLSTPWGQRGWFWKQWHSDNALWQRFRIPWDRCPRLAREFIDEERRKFGESWVSQEYECSFTAMEGLVYPSFADQTRTDLPAPPGKLVGGIDFGFRNPFAAVWGPIRDDVLYLENEIYVRETPLSVIAARLPKNVLWYADPAGAVEIAELRLAGFAVRGGINDIRAGIAAVTARLQSQRLRVNERRCPNLMMEARLYRYPTDSQRVGSGENPVDDNNHALAALRYLICSLDARAMARLRRQDKAETREPALEIAEQASAAQSWLRVGNEQLWS